MKRLPILRIRPTEARSFLLYGFKTALAVSLSYLAIHATGLNELHAAGMLRRLSTDKLIQILAFYQALLHLSRTVDVFADRMAHVLAKTPAS